MWQTFIADFKERYAKYDTFHGIVLVVFGLILVYVAIFDLPHILHAMAALFGIGKAVEGVYMIFHNPIKKAIAQEELKLQRIARTALGVKDAQPPAQ